MNTLEVVPKIELGAGLADADTWGVWCELLVDGDGPWRIQDDIGCLADLVRTTQDGRFFPMNCSCGNRGCGGYNAGVRVVHSQDGTVEWTMLDVNDVAARTRPLIFDSTQAAEAVQGCVVRIRERLLELRGQEVTFACWDDAEVFGLVYGDFRLIVPLDYGQA